MSDIIFSKIKKIIAEQFNIAPENISLETSFYKDLSADSLDLFQIITELEDEFNLEFLNEDADKIKTIGDVVNYIKSKSTK